MYNDLFLTACQNNNLEDVRRYLAMPEVDIHYSGDIALGWACKNNNIEVVKYLLTSPELSEHASIEAGDFVAFKLACDYGHSELVKFLVLDYDVQLDNLTQYLETKTFLLKKDIQEIIKMKHEKDTIHKEIEVGKSVKVQKL